MGVYLFHNKFGKVGENVEVSGSLCDGIALGNRSCLNALPSVGLADVFNNPGVLEIKFVAS